MTAKMKSVVSSGEVAELLHARAQARAAEAPGREGEERLDHVIPLPLRCGERVAESHHPPHAVRRVRHEPDAPRDGGRDDDGEVPPLHPPGHEHRHRHHADEGGGAEVLNDHQ